MSGLTSESTVYVTYIAATPARVWAALTSSAFTTQYFFGHSVESDWQQGSAWLLRAPDGKVTVHGVVREADPPHRLVVSWNVDGADVAECVVSYTIEPVSETVIRLTMIEAHPTPIAAQLLEGGRKGWPMILAGLKSLLETGQRLDIPTPGPPQGG